MAQDQGALFLVNHTFTNISKARMVCMAQQLPKDGWKQLLKQSDCHPMPKEQSNRHQGSPQILSQHHTQHTRTKL